MISQPDIAVRVASLRDAPGLANLRRSLDVYYGTPERDAAMDRLYRRFLSPGKLAFDIGAHVGDRIGSFRRCGARVVALEPQPDCAAAVRAIYAGDGSIELVEAACGPAPGRLQLHINSANPTVTTASHDFVQAADGAGGWEGQVWDKTIEVPVTTLDALVAKHGAPDFVKIDVEGAEARVLGGATFAAKRETRFLVEMHAMPELSMEANADLILEWARRVGYAVWYMSQAQRLESAELIKHRGRCHLLLQPADWPYPDWLASISQSAPLPAT